MALESSSRSVFALTPWRLVCGYPNGRKSTHESTCGVCGSAAAAFVLPAILSSSLLLVHAAATAGGLCCSTYLLYYLRLADRSQDAGGSRFKGISTIFNCDTLDPESLMTCRVKITKRVTEARKLQARLRFSQPRDHRVAFILHRNPFTRFSILIPFVISIKLLRETCILKKLIKYISLS